MKASPSLAAAPRVADWLSFADDVVTVHTGKVEIGQRIGTALRAIVADQLTVPIDRVEVAVVDTERSPDEGYTSGSNSVEHSGSALGAAAATAREVLRARAADALGTPLDTVVLEHGVFRCPGSNRFVTLWEVATGTDFPLAVDPAAPLTTAASPRHVGSAVEAAGLRDLICGKTRFLHDLGPPGMLHARVVRPPNYHARLVRLGAAGFDDPRYTLVRDGSFVAVAGPDEFTVVRYAARVAAGAEWIGAPAGDERSLSQRIMENPRLSLRVIDGTPINETPEERTLERDLGSIVMRADYFRPYQMHGSIGPSAAMAEDVAGTLTVWSHTQGVFPLQGALAELFELPRASVRVVHVRGAGCYGHNGADDVAVDAAIVARALPGRTVLVKWSREDEHAWEPYAPAMQVRMQARVGADGTVLEWCHDAYGDTHAARPRVGPGGVGPARLLAARHIANARDPYVPIPNMGRHAGLHRNADPIYNFARRAIGKHLVSDLPLRTSAMRTLGAFANVFAIESFMDELAGAVGADPLVFRLAHLDDPRARAVLERAARAIGWAQRDAHESTGRGTGLGFARYKNAQAYAAVGVRLAVGEDARVRLEHAVIAADAGCVIDRDGLSAQLEGGFLQAASWTLCEEVKFDGTGILSRDWESYPILRFGDVPEVETILLDRPELPSLGAGECASGPTGAAIANAIFAASGVRARRMPFTPDNLRAAAAGQAAEDAEGAD